MSNLPQEGTPPDVVRVATAQFYSGEDVTANLATVVAYMREAAAAGAQLLVLPENSNRARTFASRQDAWDACETLDGDFVRGVQYAARSLELMVAVGVDLRGAEEPHVHIGQVLIDATGDILHVHHKTVFWDYEYTLFTAGSKPLAVIDTRIGRIGQLSCADGIVPEVPRVLGLLGAQIFVNSLNSRGPDEMRLHEPLRAMENHVWHVAANTVGGPADGYPWTGGSQVISPTGESLVCAGEVEEGLVWADITPHTAHPKVLGGIGALDDFRRPDRYAELLAPVDSHRAAEMYGPVPPGTAPRPLTIAALQTSWYHATEWTLTRAAAQVAYAKDRGVGLGVFPELFIHRPGEVAADPAAAAELSARALEVLRKAAGEHEVHVVASLVERDGDQFFHTAYLLGADGNVTAAYRKVHLDEEERTWASAGDDFVVADTPVGRIGLMIGTEVWLPEVARILSLRGAEVIAHPVSWERPEAALLAAVQRTEENRTHLVSATRTDGPTAVGSQVVVADRYQPGQPVALMRYPTTVWSRAGFEENIVFTLDLVDSHSKVQGENLDPLATRQPALYGSFTSTFGASA